MAVNAHNPEGRRAPRLRQRSNGSLYAYFYDPNRSPTRKRVALGVISEAMDKPQDEASSATLELFYREYHDPYLRGTYDPWSPGGSKVEKIPLIEAVEAFSNRKSISENTKRTLSTTLSEFIWEYLPSHDMRPGEVTTEQVEGYIRREDISSAYRSSLYARLSAFFNWAVDNDLLLVEQNPMRGVKRPQKRPTTKPFLSPNLARKLVQAIREDYDRRSKLSGRKGINENELRWVIGPLEWGMATGMRPAEIQMLKIKDVDIISGRVDVPELDGETKGTQRTIPLNAMAERVYDENGRGRLITENLFPGSRSDQFCTRRLSRVVKSYLKDISPDVDLYGATRHTFASWLAMMGYPIHTISALLGHTSTRVTESYMHVSPSALDRGMGGRFRSLASDLEEMGFYESYVQFK